MAYIVNSLELETYGLYVSLIFLLGAGQLLVRFGLDSLGPVSIIKNDEIDYEFVRSVIVCRLLVFLIIFICTPILYITGIYFSEGIDLVILVIGISICIFDVFKFTIERDSRSDLISIARFGSFLPSLAVRFLGAYLGLYQVIIIGVVIEAFLFVLITGLLSPYKISLRQLLPSQNPLDKEVLFSNIPFFLIGLYVYFYVRYPIWADWAVHIPNDTANFIFAYKIIEPFFALSGIIVFIASASIIRLETASAYSSRVILASGFAIGVIISLLIAASADFVIRIFFRPELQQSVSYIKVLCFALPFNFLGSLWQRICLAESDRRLVFLRTGISLVFFTVFILFPKDTVWFSVIGYLCFIIVHDGVLPLLLSGFRIRRA